MKKTLIAATSVLALVAFSAFADDAAKQPTDNAAPSAPSATATSAAPVASAPAATDPASASPAAGSAAPSSAPASDSSK